MPKKMTSNALEILADIAGHNPAVQLELQQEIINRDVAAKIYKLRHSEGLSQAELARRIGTTQSVISRLEDADYDGHSLSMLKRIAAALKHRVEGSPL
jgi:ribosome-binding protein aMBF1 (putative translation factor)